MLILEAQDFCKIIQLRHQRLRQIDRTYFERRCRDGIPQPAPAAMALEARRFYSLAPVELVKLFADRRSCRLRASIEQHFTCLNRSGERYKDYGGYLAETR